MLYTPDIEINCSTAAEEGKVVLYLKNMDIVAKYLDKIGIVLSEPSS